MQSFTIRDLRERIGDLSREAEQGKLSLVTRRGTPLFVSVPFDENLVQHGVHRALAENLYQNGALSLGQAAKLADMPLVEFIEYLSQLGIPVVDYPPTELSEEMRYFDT